MAELKEALRDLLLEADFSAKLQQLVSAAVETAVVRATEQCTAKIEALESELKTTKEKLSSTEKRLDQLEQHSRQNCLVISGVPEKENENTDSLMLDVAKAAGVQLSPDDIDRSHRMGRATGNRPRIIIAKFVSHNIRQKLFDARKDLSAHRVRDHPTLSRDVIESVYIAECLTPKNQDLLYIARQLKKRNKLWAAYSTNGKVKVKLGEKQPAKIIEATNDFHSIFEASDSVLQEILATAHSGHPRRDGATGTSTPTQQDTGRGSAGAEDAGAWGVTSGRGNRSSDKGRRHQPRRGSGANH